MDSGCTKDDLSPCEYVDVNGQKRHIAQCLCDCPAFDRFMSNPTSKEHFHEAVLMLCDRIRIPYTGGAHRVSPKTILYSLGATCVLPIHFALVPTLAVLIFFAAPKHWAFVVAAVMAEIVHFVMEALWEDQPALALAMVPLMWLCPSSKAPGGPEYPWQAPPKMQGAWFTWLVCTFGYSHVMLTSPFHQQNAAIVCVLGCCRLLHVGWTATRNHDDGMTIPL
eukprot:GEMP01078706.1.p1 GENE.GEMP01078706.1~~GEMP01078706.1.p1  ORF type:complete len:222 (+),score=48.61 GEMP01078706.1:85-750(+)